MSCGGSEGIRRFIHEVRTAGSSEAGYGTEND
jgi:hypothetical protein